ncbi:MAG: HAMP domain-containing histidine kinase [Clostridiales bacterium]|jgi:signal transduction histidine kinase|nr:HAMP domain-containing histidine kinase [Clostridiales bacterium]
MIRKTRLKFFFVTAAIVVVMVSAFCAAVLVNAAAGDAARARLALEKAIREYEMPHAGQGRPGTFNDARIFAVKLDGSGAVVGVKSAGFYSEPDILAHIAAITADGAASGKIGDLRFLIADADADGGRILAAIDTGIENESFRRLTPVVLLSGGGGILLLSAAAWFLSFWIVKPLAAGLEKQKRFISEASHELKTPLTVISAGAELLRRQIGEKADRAAMGKWLGEIQAQTERMAAMAADLLSLSKLDEGGSGKTPAAFDLPRAVLNAVLPFEAVAFERGKAFRYDIQTGLPYKGDPKAVAQAVGILCDNALKHSDEGGTVEIALKNRNGRAVLSVSNTGGGAVNKAELPLLFERFYRGAAARAETNGSGLGLSVLKAVAEKNNWRVKVETNGGVIAFTLAF